jgi:hypothetical protein
LNGRILTRKCIKYKSFLLRIKVWICCGYRLRLAWQGSGKWVGAVDLSYGNTAGAIKALVPVALPHVFYPDCATRGRGMHKAVLTEIDADVGETPAKGIEEYKVAWLQCLSVYGFPKPADVARGAW